MENFCLKVTNLTKIYKQKTILNKVNLDIPKGNIAGLVGQNGVGKTILIKCILGLVTFSSGPIDIGEFTNISKKKPMLKGIGALVESPGLYPYLSGFENIRMFAKDVDKALLDELLSIFRMEDYIQKKVSGYSLGMKQKVGILQAIVVGKKIVLLDEPLNGLDPQSVKDFRTIVQRLSKNGVTFLISSHLISELQMLADTIFVLKKEGQIEKVDLNEKKETNWLYFDTNNNGHFYTALTREGIVCRNKNLKVLVNMPTSKITNKVFKIISENRIKVNDIRQGYMNLEGEILKYMGQDDTNE